MLFNFSSWRCLPFVHHSVRPGSYRSNDVNTNILLWIFQNNNPLVLISSLWIKEIDSSLRSNRRKNFILLLVWTFNSNVFLKILTKRHSNHWVLILRFCFSSLLRSEEIGHSERHTCKLVLEVIFLRLLHRFKSNSFSFSCSHKSYANGWMLPPEMSRGDLLFYPFCLVFISLVICHQWICSR